MSEIGEQLPNVMWRLDAEAFHRHLAAQTLTPGGPSPILLRDLASRSADVRGEAGRRFLEEIEFDADSVAQDDPATLYITSMAPFVLDIEPVAVDWLVVEAALGVATSWLGEEVRMLRYGSPLARLSISLGFGDFAEMVHGWRLNAGWLSPAQARDFRERLASETVFISPDRGQRRAMRWLADSGIDVDPEAFGRRLARASDQLAAHLVRIAARPGHVVF